MTNSTDVRMKQHFARLTRFLFGLILLAQFGLLSGCATLKSSQDKLMDLISPSGSSISASNIRDDLEFGQRSPNRVMLSDLAPGEISTTVRARLAGENRAQAEKYFREAQATYDEATQLWEEDSASDEAQKKFLLATRGFKLAAASWKDSALEQDSLFMIGEAHFFAHQYVLANRAYEQLVASYPGTQHMDLVQNRRFKIAQYWLEVARNRSNLDPGINFTDQKLPLNDLVGSARRIFHSIRLDDPTGKIADDATFALANAFFEAGKYEEAADAYEDLRRTYPGSQYQYQAHLFELKTRLACYRGADYDGTQLTKADQIMRVLATQFPDKIDKDREYLQQEAGRIRHLMAERDYTIGQYYERLGQNQAAELYYAGIQDDFGDTELAGQAKERIGMIADEPPVPDQPAEWLVNLFPEPRATKPLIKSGGGGTIMR